MSSNCTKNILVIGDICEDIFIRGSVVQKVNAEAPCVVLNTHNCPVTINQGMVGNVIANIKSISKFFDLDLSITSLHNEEKIQKVRYVDATSGYILLREDREGPIEKPATIDDVSGYYDYIVIADYDKGFVTEEFVEELCDVYYNTPIILDTKKVLGNWSRRTIVKINTNEYNYQLQHNAKPYNYCKLLIVTRGSRGCAIVSQDGEQLLSGNEVEVADVAGAGDSFCAGFVVSRIVGNGVMESLVFANTAASIAVSKRGVVAVSADDFKKWHSS